MSHPALSHVDLDSCSPVGIQTPTSRCEGEGPPPPPDPQPDPPPKPDPKPDPQPAPDLTKVMSALEGLTNRLTEIEGVVTAPPNPDPTPEPDPKPKPDPKVSRQLSEAQKAAAKADAERLRALGLAKRALVRSHLSDIESAEYLKLVPDVELDESGVLTEDSVEALDEFKEANPRLFRQSAYGYSPMPGGTPGSKGLSGEDQAALLSIDVTPGEWRKRANPAVVAQLDRQMRSR